jgi:hypothetical protein
VNIRWASKEDGKPRYVDEKGRECSTPLLALLHEKDPKTLFVWEGGTYVMIYTRETTDGDFEESECFSSTLWGNGAFESVAERKVRLKKEIPHVVESVRRRMEEREEEGKPISKMNSELLALLTRSSTKVAIPVINTQIDCTRAVSDFLQEVKALNERANRERYTDTGEVWDLLSAFYEEMTGEELPEVAEDEEER